MNNKIRHASRCLHQRYLQALRMCQVSGRKLGHFDWSVYRGCTTYVLDGKVWQFHCGVILGPQDYFEWLGVTRSEMAKGEL